jgi:hypothetical protein
MTATLVAQTREASETKKFWPHDLLLGLLPLLIGFQLLLVFTYLPQGLSGHSDMRQLYTGAYMVRTGHGTELYKYEVQQRFEEILVPVQEHFVLPVNHLAYEELLLAPLTFFSYRTAYIAFMALNVVLLVLCAWLLTASMEQFGGTWKWLFPLIILTFCPLSRALIGGQDSIIMLTLLTGALLCIQRDNEFTAGLLVGLGVFKFQITVPIAILYLLWRRWRFVGGFAISSGVAGLISLALVGVTGVHDYVDMLLSMSVRLSSQADILRYCTSPVAMGNLRGLAHAILEGRLAHVYVQIVVAVASIAVLVVAARQRPSLPLAIAAASLVSYHFLAHDASVLIIVIGVALCSGSVLTGAVGIALLLAPFIAFLPRHGYEAAIPLIAVFALTLRPARASTAICSSQQEVVPA